MASIETAVRAALTLPTSATGPNNVTEAKYVGDLDPSTVVLQAAGNASATFVYEVSLDKTNWFQCGASLVETTTFSDETAMQTAGSNPRVAAMWARLRCSVFSSITSITFCVAGVPKSL